MRAILSLVTVGLVGTATPHTPARYLVIPTGHAVDAGVRPCPPSLSAGGAIVAFEAHVPLDPADQNGGPDVYLLERATNRVTLVSRNLAGGAGRGGSRCPRVSGDGQRVTFESDVADLVPGDPPGTTDVFLFDSSTGVLRRIVPMTDAGSTMSARPALSADGRVVVFDASAVGATPDERRRVYRATVDTGVVQDLGEGHSATVSGDGHVVAFLSRLRPGAPQIIRVVAPESTRTVGASGGQMGEGDVFAPALSADGQWIAYVSRPGSTRTGGTDVARAQIYVERVRDGLRHLVSTTPQGREANGFSKLPAIDATGNLVVFESTATNIGCGSLASVSCDTDINLLGDIFLWNKTTGIVTRVNAATSELPWLEGAAYPTVSTDGSSIAFLSRQPVSDADGRDTFDLFIARR